LGYEVRFTAGGFFHTVVLHVGAVNTAASRFVKWAILDVGQQRHVPKVLLGGFRMNAFDLTFQRVVPLVP
jgi:hypothetical protein